MSRVCAVGRLQSQVADVVSRIRDAVAVDAGKGRAAMNNPEIAALHSVWQQEYADDADWSAVQPRLHEVLVAARVVEVNASKRAQALDYDQGGEHGVTIIAVGGFSLSRGLTLEGLTVSYFLRNSIMYDTLMQMGRWFGYHLPRSSRRPSPAFSSAPPRSSLWLNVPATQSLKRFRRWSRPRGVRARR
jgi:hypothetical protein